MLLQFVLAGLAAVSAPAQESAAGPAADDARVNQLIVYGSDACPPGNEDEIIVCARLPEEERFRIPPSLRDRPGFGGRTWYDRAIDLSYVGRSGIGSCTPSDAGGFIGCQNQLIARARAERRAEQDINWARLVAEARADRSRRIDRDAAEIERTQSEDE
ncbi:MAG TPA: hypothetical protein VEZ20_08315 [Allosphingosinicella sp.]|jgi:hypothetical protein|nr:hypothetical protein [Allosphingosinicella sp.]